jgi:hypothetical protein
MCAILFFISPVPSFAIFMKKKESIRILLIVSGFLVILTGSAFTAYYPGGSPGGYSGSPLDGQNCTHCHGGTPITQSGIISSNIDNSGYIPGSTYTITVSVPGTGLKGFEVSPLNSANQKTGTLIAGFENRIPNSGKSVTQSITSGSDPAIWTFQWTAPIKGTGTVTFYGAFAAGKTHTLLSTMVVAEKNGSSIESERAYHINFLYNADSKKLIFESNNVQPAIFSGTIYSIEGKERMQIPKKELLNNMNKWEIDVSGLEMHKILILKYSLGKSTGFKKINIY